MIPKHGDVVVLTILIHALNELKDLVNVGKNLTNAQVSFLANRIKERYWMYKPEEIKYVLYRAVEREKLFDRLDPNLVLGWFADYDTERTEEAMRASEHRESQMQYDIKPDAKARSWESYFNHLWDLAMYADADAVEKLALMNDNTPSRMKLLTREQQHEKELDFKTYYYNHYLRNKKNDR